MKTKLLVGALGLGSLLAFYGTGALAAPPAPAQFGLSVHVGGGDDRPPPPPPPPDDGADCLSNKAIFRGLMDEGYGKFRNYEESDDGDEFTVDARRKMKWFELDVDSCTGEILDKVWLKHN